MTSLGLSQGLAPPEVKIINGVSTSYRDCGEGESLLLVHGVGPGIDAALTWDPVLAVLVKTFRVIVVDLPGYGASGSLDLADTPANAAIHLLELLRHLDISQFAVAGHSRGGRVACEMALSSPERVRKLMCIAAGSIAPNGLLAEDGRPSAEVRAFARFGADGDTSFGAFRSAYHGIVVDPGHLPDSLLEPAYRSFVADRLDEHLERLKSLDPEKMFQGDGMAELASIQIPVSLVWGREDACSPYKRALPLIEVVRHVELHVVSGANHLITADRAGRLADLMLSFLRQEGD